MAEIGICLDFDGVVHSYASGWQGADVIPDLPVPGAFDFIKRALKYGSVYIHSCRSHQNGGMAAMQKWYAGHGGPPGVEWPIVKPPAKVYIDDRGFRFQGDWPAVVDLLTLKPWMERASAEPTQ